MTKLALRKNFYSIKINQVPILKLHIHSSYLSSQKTDQKLTFYISILGFDLTA